MPSGGCERFKDGVLALAISAVAVLMHGNAVAATLAEVRGFGSNPGNLRMWTYRPDGLAAGAPLVVALHGCRQSAAAYDDETGWIEFADRLRFVLLLPEQRSGWWSGNNALGCFNWFYAGDQTRGGGEALSVKQMIDAAISDYGLDPARVYITGLSAGGAMTAVMLAAYPETFAGGAIVAGIPYRCAEVPSYVPPISLSYASLWLGFTDPFACMSPGIDRSADEWAERVRTAAGAGPQRWPVVSIWHGTADATVEPRNAEELVEQWTAVHGTDAEPDAEEVVARHVRREYRNAAGELVVELHMITGMGHGVPIAPASADSSTADRCGTPADYVLVVGVCSAYHIARFWGLIRL